MKTKSKPRFFRVCGKDGKERGASLVEYGLLLALIAVVAVPAVRAVGQNITTTFNNANNKIPATGNFPCVATPFNPCP